MTHRPDVPASLVPYDPRWVDLFELEAEQLRDALGVQLVAVHHIGSTAIPGILAKPVLDMVAVVRSLAELDRSNALPDVLAYEALGEFGIPGRRYFRKHSPHGIRTHHLHVFAPGAAAVQRHLDFRDYLRNHPASAQAYDALKRQLAKEHPALDHGYTSGKAAFVHDIEQRAIVWRGARRQPGTAG